MGGLSFVLVQQFVFSLAMDLSIIDTVMILLVVVFAYREMSLSSSTFLITLALSSTMLSHILLLLIFPFLPFLIPHPSLPYQILLLNLVYSLPMSILMEVVCKTPSKCQCPSCAINRPTNSSTDGRSCSYCTTLVSFSSVL